MAAKNVVRRSVTLPAKLARRVRRQKEKAFYNLAERFRVATDPKEIERLGNELGRMVFRG